MKFWYDYAKNISWESFHHWGYTRKFWAHSVPLILLIYTIHKTKGWNLGPTPRPHVFFLKLCKCFQILHLSPRVTSTPNRTKTKHHWLNHLQILHTHTLNNATSLALVLRERSQTSWVTKNLGLISTHHSLATLNKRVIKAEWWDVPLALRDFSQSNKSERFDFSLA